MRKPSACNACRARRRKCTFPSGANATACEYCLSHGLPCTQGPPEGGYYARRLSRKQKLGVVRLMPASAQQHWPCCWSLDAQRTAEEQLPPISVRVELVKLYFDFIHDQFHSLFHRPSFIEDVVNDRVPTIVLFAIFALSSRFSVNEAFAGSDPRERGERFRLACEGLLSIRDVEIVNIQTFMLLGAYAAANGDTDVENLYYGLAGRMALSLNIPELPVTSLLERELNLRVWWTLCMVDVWSSTAVKLPKIMPSNQKHSLPMDELSFLSISPGDQALVPSSPPPPFQAPLLAEMVKLNLVLAKVIEFNHRCVAEPLDSGTLEKGVRELTSELDDWLANLPAHMRDTAQNLDAFSELGLGRMADVADSSNPFHQYAERCKDYAARLCELVYRSVAAPGSDVKYSAVSHILVISSTVQIHTLLFSGDETQIRLAKSRLERNFEILLQLKTYWSSADSAMNRLQVFHHTCLRSRETSFVLDRWLLRFLVEFAAHMEFEPKDIDTGYEALLSLSKH
ncbi:hypothetical protein PG991_006751 [Apiospora marii]|uniref:Zn(2)-C6 fungal-type domain-containing protein n=1 Tax=Apiospora marii TaxID=335849 RepID=A0ABR1RY87_9PEZI